MHARLPLLPLLPHEWTPCTCTSLRLPASTATQRPLKRSDKCFLFTHRGAAIATTVSSSEVGRRSSRRSLGEGDHIVFFHTAGAVAAPPEAAPVASAAAAAAAAAAAVAAAAAAVAAAAAMGAAAAVHAAAAAAPVADIHPHHVCWSCWPAGAAASARFRSPVCVHAFAGSPIAMSHTHAWLPCVLRRDADDARAVVACQPLPARAAVVGQAAAARIVALASGAP